MDPHSSSYAKGVLPFSALTQMKSTIVWNLCKKWQGVGKRVYIPGVGGVCVCVWGGGGGDLDFYKTQASRAKSLEKYPW